MEVALRLKDFEVNAWRMLRGFRARESQRESPLNPWTSTAQPQIPEDIIAALNLPNPYALTS